jgi:hypothetical protein
MTNRTQTASLDEVLAAYAEAAQGFDAKVLQAFVRDYPEHAQALQNYAHVQLTSVPATREEMDAWDVSDEELLPLQSKLLQRMHQLRPGPADGEVDQALQRLSSISGSKATEAAASAVFGSVEHGEDLLLITITEADAPVEATPNWFYRKLGAHAGVPGPIVQAALAKRGRVSRQQRHSSRSKPVHSPPMTWEEAVDECITDDEAKRAILDQTDDA